MKRCDWFPDDRSMPGIEVYQVTDDVEAASLVYPDQPSFLADGRSVIVETSAGPAVCDLHDGSLRELFPGSGAKVSVRATFDGRYAFFKRPADQGKPLVIARMDLDTLHTEDVFAADGTLPGTDIPSQQFTLDTVSSDNGRIASKVFLGDGKTPDAPFGIIVLDLKCGSVRQVIQGKDFHNPHLQYCRSTDPEASHDLLVQMNHGARIDASGKVLAGLGPPEDLGVDLHVVRDDGSDWRDLPFGRDGVESCIGHQVWRGQGQGVATITLENLDTSYGWADGTQQRIIAGWPVAADPDGEHLGRRNPGAQRVELSAGFASPRFCHLACDATGLKFAVDTFPIFDGRRTGMHVYIGRAPNDTSPLELRYLVNTAVVFKPGVHYHAHPILSPDGSMLLFNSNITGKPQVYLVRGF